MNVDHVNSVSRFSPFLFLSLVLLTYNMIFTLIGVVQNREGSGLNATIYYGSLAVFFLIGIISVIFKHYFLYRSQKRMHHRRCELAKSGVYDLTFVAMGMLYLAGDNLPIFICSEIKNTNAKEECRGQSSIILGFTLLLHTLLYVFGVLKLKPTEMPTFPVTGRIRKAYQSVLQLAALTIFLDQTFSTVERLVTHLDIEGDETPNFGTATNCSSIINAEVGGFFAGLCVIMLFVVLGLVVKNWKDYYSCYNDWLTRKKKIGQCCCHLWENVFVFIFHLINYAG